MRIVCLKGFYKLYPNTSSELNIAEKIFNQGLFRGADADKDYYTFEPLTKVKSYSLAGATGIGGEIYKKTYSGSLWEVLSINELTLNLKTGLITDINTITDTERLKASQTRFSANRLLQAFARTADGKQIKTFGAFFDVGRGIYFYDRVYIE